jgi:thioredoxin reductase
MWWLPDSVSMDFPMQRYDVLIIGSGLAAATLALSLPASMKILLVTKKCVDRQLQLLGARRHRGGDGR